MKVPAVTRVQRWLILNVFVGALPFLAEFFVRSITGHHPELAFTHIDDALFFSVSLSLTTLGDVVFARSAEQNFVVQIAAFLSLIVISCASLVFYIAAEHFAIVSRESPSDAAVLVSIAYPLILFIFTANLENWIGTLEGE